MEFGFLCCGARQQKRLIVTAFAHPMTGNRYRNKKLQSLISIHCRISLCDLPATRSTKHNLAGHGTEMQNGLPHLSFIPKRRRNAQTAGLSRQSARTSSLARDIRTIFTRLPMRTESIAEWTVFGKHNGKQEASQKRRNFIRSFLLPLKQPAERSIPSRTAIVLHHRQQRLPRTGKNQSSFARVTAV